MIPYETNIDTVALQLDLDDALRQRTKLQMLISWIIGRKLGKLEEVVSNPNIIKYKLLFGNTKLLTIHTGSTRIRDRVTGRFKSLYYIRIRFAGLKSHNFDYDRRAFNCLMNICSFLNTTSTPFKLTELDLAIDLFGSFDNVLVACTRKASYVTYNPLGFKQYFNGVPTSYIEDYRELKQRRNAVMRSYLYNKSAKNRLPFTVTRFEIKLQNRFFVNNGFNLNSIVNALDKYYVMHFRNRIEKQQVINNYNNYKNVTNREINRLGLHNYRIYPNTLAIDDFINKILSVYVDCYGNVTLPANFNTQNKNFF